MQNQHLLGIIVVFLGVFAPAAQTQTNGGLGGMMGGVGKGAIAVQTTDAIDSNGSAAGRTYRASVARATTINGISVPQGSPAVLTLQQANNSWTITIASINAGGTTLPMTGGTPSLKGGGIMNSVSDPGSILSGGIPWGKKKPAANTPAAIPVSASGARVYLPANTNILFMNTRCTAQAPQQTQASAAAPQPAAQSPATQSPATQPVAYQTGQQNAGSQNQNFQSPANQSVTNSASGNSVVFKSIQYQLSGCHREAPHIVCELQVTNTGSADTALKGDPRTYFIDQAGNKNLVKSATVANCNLGVCEMLPQLNMKARYIFADETGEAKTLVRLQFWAGGEQVAQFQNVPVQ